MSNAYSLLLQTAVLLKVDMNQVKEDGLTASLMVQDVEVAVRCTKGAKNRSPMARAKFSCGCFSIESEPFLGDYAEKLVGMIKSVAYKKKYSAPWISVAVKERLARKMKKCRVTLENDHVAILTLPLTSGTKSDKKLQLSIVELSGNSIGSYYYRVDYLDGPTIDCVIDVADLDQAVKDIADIAEGAYSEWCDECKAPAQPKTAYEKDMDDLFQFLKTRYKNMKDSSRTFTRISGKSLSISNIKNGDNWYISYGGAAGEISLRTIRKRDYRSSYKRFKLDDPKRFEKVASIVFSFEAKE